MSVVGSSVLVGWALDIERLRAVAPRLDSMKPLTALLLVALGTSVLLGVRSGAASGLALAGAVVATVVGAATVGEYVSGGSAGFDTWLFGPAVRAEGGEFPGRMAPFAAAAITLLGGSLLAARAGWTRVAHVGGLVVMGGAGATLAGYLYGVDSLRQVGPFSSVALHTAFCLFLLAVAVLWLTPDHGLPALASRGRGASVLVRRSLPVVLVVPFLIGWVRLAGERAGWYGTEFGLALMAVSASAVASLVLWRAALVVADFEDQREDAFEQLQRINASLEQRVTERTAALAETEATLRASLDALEEGVALVGGDSEVLILNPAGAQLLGYDAAQLTELSRSGRWETFREDGSVMPREERPIARAMSTAEASVDAIVGWRTSTGAVITLRVRTRLLHAESGGRSGIVVAFADVTAERAAERARAEHLAELRKLNDVLEQAVSVKDHFLGVASHDMRTPITSILGFADLLARGGERFPESERAGALDTIIRQARRLDALVGDLLSISVIDGGALSIEPEAVDVRAALVEIVADAAQGAPVEVRAVDGVRVHVDPHRLAQMVTNLLVNATRYGELPISLEVRADGPWVTVTVADCGPGVPAEFVPALFDKFSTANRATTRAVRGSGLGLAIVRGLAQAHGGDVWYEPNQPRGARFSLRLPSRAPLADRPAEDAAGLAPSASEPVGSMHVLVLDDDPDVRALLRHELERVGHTVVTVDDGLRALTAVRVNTPDLLIADIDVPSLDGLELLARLKADPSTAAVPVLLLTGRHSAEEAARAFGLGAADFLRKPIELVELTARVSAVLATAESTGDLQRANRELDRSARTDALTGLMNRRGLDEQIERLASLARRHDLTVSALMIDVDHFKAVNDTHGHLAGDQVLHAVAQAIEAVLRTEDVAGRWGGEEFLVLLPATPAHGAVAVAERMRVAVESVAVSAPNGPICVTISVGVAEASTANLLEAVAEADRYLYRAKAAGRNRVVASVPFQVEAPRG